MLGSEIGRGHPFYMDGLRQALRSAGRADLIARDTDVFREARGISQLAWAGVRHSYRWAGHGGVVSHLYHRARRGTNYDEDSAALRILGRDLRRWAGSHGVVVVDHPAVAGALGDRADTWYLHGEMVAPPESVVRRAARIFVPLEETAAAFVRGGVPRERLVVTGVCVESGLIAEVERTAQDRRRRLAGKEALTVAFFSSGAEPPGHVALLAAAAGALAGSGRHRVLAFTARGGRLARTLAATVPHGAETLTYTDRASMDALTAEHFPRFDAVVSPPHERSNWAVALGVPFFLVGPDIGPFAPLNRRLLLDRGVAAAIESPAAANAFPDLIDRLRERGELQRMVESGRDVSSRGFEHAAEFVISEAERTGHADGNAAHA